MRVDVSELKTRRDCSRKWALSSRNYYHMKPKSDNSNLKFGSIFHEALAGLYLSRGESEKIDRVIDKYVSMLDDESQQKQLACMLIGYATQVLPGDLEKYTVLDIEHKFEFELPDELTEGRFEWAKDLKICGSIDMVLLDKKNKEILGFEHKSCKNFRTDFYNSVDEQPRTYYIALDQYIAKYNAHYGTDYTNGGIYVNEVRKLKTRFEHHRMNPIICTDEECKKFLIGFRATAERIYFAQSMYRGNLPDPEPSYMKCNLCDFRDVCEHYGYSTPTEEEILSEFAEEIEIREFDHLDEKVERSGETEDAVPISL